jgi:hypothetical protein
MTVCGTAGALGEIGAGAVGLIDAGIAGARGRGRNWRRAAAAMAMLAAWVVPAVAVTAHDTEPPLRIPLVPLGYQTMSPEFLLEGDSTLTVHFVDNNHLLVTFAVRRLMKREADTRPDDDDRTIEAVLLELPSGKMLARTEWRVHDRLQYLWSLGHGRFLLRVRDQLMMISPLAAATPDDAFREFPFLQVERHIVAILISPDGDLLTIETTKRTGAKDSIAVSLGDSTPTDTAPVQVNFYRLNNTDDSANGLQVSSAGAVRTRVPVALPITAAGSLDVLEGGKNRWLFNFNEHAGKVDELAEWDTSCFPRPLFVGHAEFVAFGCRGSDDNQEIAGFNLKGEEMWQQGFYEPYVSPLFAFAPSAGRFALGRTIVSSPMQLDSPLPASLVTAQEVRVYQSYSGKQLFRIDLTPVERAGQNFALSPDGLRLAAVRETQVHHAATKDSNAYTQLEAGLEVYALPPLTDDDQAVVKKTEASAPQDTGARIDLSLERVTAAGATAAASGVDSPAAAPTAGDAALPNAPAAENQAGTTAAGGTATAGEGDAVPAAPRKPPTLYGPDEKPSGKPQ